MIAKIRKRYKKLYCVITFMFFLGLYINVLYVYASEKKGKNVDVSHQKYTYTEMKNDIFALQKNTAIILV